MNTMQSTKPLWATIGGLVVAVGALGGVLVHQQYSGNKTPRPPSVASLEPVRAPEPPPVQQAPPQPPAQLAQPVAAPPAQASAPAPVTAPVCAVCGHVESVRTIQRPAPTTGVGAVAGGVLGGVVGNQFGHGGGRAATTVLGAVGGGFLGNHIEQRTRTVTSYDVRVRMADGSLRSVETRTAPPVGKAVTLEGKVLRAADGRRG